MKWFSLILLSVFLVNLAVAAHAQDADIYDREYLVIDNVIGSSIKTVRTSAHSDLDYLQTNLYFQPISDPRLEVIDFLSIPEAKKEDGQLTFRWNGNLTDKVTFQLDSTIKTKTVYDIISNKVSFPIKDLGPEFEDYLKETETVDFENEKIRQKATELTTGTDDMYIAVNDIALWIQDNIQYNLSTVTAEASQKASWVMDNRYGVCDEITNLFLAMTRSVGIPSRFVSGLAYTNSPLFEERWGAHGWAEVYFPDHGWVPFDITYNQYGWLDPSHIKLKESLDATDPSTKFEWKGTDVELDVKPLNITANILEKGPKVNFQMDIRAEPLKNITGFGSHNLIKAELINYNNYYKTTDIALAPTEGITLLDPASKTVILKPYDKVVVSWEVKIQDDLKNDFVYTFPIVVYNQRNVTSSTSFEAKNGEPVFSRQEIELLKSAVDPKVTKVLTTEVGLDCDALFKTMSAYQKNFLNCSITNKANQQLEDIRTCYEGDCQISSLFIGESKEVLFDVGEVSEGKNEEVVTLTVDDKSLTDSVEIVVEDIPSVVIENLTYPSITTYDDEFEIGFTVKKESLQDPKDISIQLTGGIYKDFFIEDLDQKQRFVIKTKGAYLSPKDNIVKIDVLYHDDKYQRYTLSEQFVIKMEHPSFIHRIMMYVNRLGLWFDRFISMHEPLFEEE